MTARIIRKLADLRALHTTWRKAGETVGVVPTMGALHDGHLSLVKAAEAKCDRIIVTIFVNPRQFNSPEDLANYPRTEDGDAAKLSALRVDVIYVPDPDQIYPEGYATSVTVAGLTDVMEGEFRPGHFEGVATVCCKLFLQTGADLAFLGEKDFQQLMVVRRMAQDLDVPISVIGCATVREPSGLAMSSRNRRLSDSGMSLAESMYPVLTGLVDDLRSGGSFGDLAPAALEELGALGVDKVEYLDLRCVYTLQALETACRPARLFFAAWVDGVRLIDNLAVTPLSS